MPRTAKHLMTESLPAYCGHRYTGPSGIRHDCYTLLKGTPQDQPPAHTGQHACRCGTVWSDSDEKGDSTDGQAHP